MRLIDEIMANFRAVRESIAEAEERDRLKKEEEKEQAEREQIKRENDEKEARFQKSYRLGALELSEVLSSLHEELNCDGEVHPGDIMLKTNRKKGAEYAVKINRCDNQLPRDQVEQALNDELGRRRKQGFSLFGRDVLTVLVTKEKKRYLLRLLIMKG